MIPTKSKNQFDFRQVTTFLKLSVDSAERGRRDTEIKDEAKIAIPHYLLTPGDVKAIEESFGLVAASASVKDLGIGFFRM